MTTIETRVTTADFDAFLARPENEDRLFELIDGEIVEKMPSFGHGMVAAKLVIAVGNYLTQNPIGRISIEAQHQDPADPFNSRLPDVCVVLGKDKVVVWEGATLYMPDLAIEVKSPRNSLKMLRDKAHYYLAHGAKLVWIILPVPRIIEVYTLDEESVLGVDEMLTGGDVLPGFSIAVRAVFED